MGWLVGADLWYVAEGTSATVLWECSEGVICCLGVLDLLDSSCSNSGGLFTGLLGALESFDLACFSGSIECLLSGDDFEVKFGLHADEVIILLLDWSEVVEGPLLSGIVEGLLGLNALLGGEGGGQNGSSSSSRNGSDILGNISSDGGISQCGLGDDSGSLFLLGGGESELGSSFSTGSWGDVSNEIDKERLSTCEIAIGSLLLGLGKSLPSFSGSLVLVGGGEDRDLAGLGGLGFTNLSGSEPVIGLVGLITDKGELGSECGITPVREPEIDQSHGLSLPLGVGNGDGVGFSECWSTLSSSKASSKGDIGLSIADALHERIKHDRISGSINTVRGCAPGVLAVCLAITLELPASSLHGLKEELCLLPCFIAGKSDEDLAAVCIGELITGVDAGVISILEGEVELSWWSVGINTSNTLSSSVGSGETGGVGS